MYASNHGRGAPPRAEIDIVGAVRFDFERIRLAPRYRVGLFFAAVTMLLLPVVYVGLIGLVGYGVWYHATHNIGIIGAYTNIYVIVAVYVGPIIGGVLGILFMVKPLFAPRLEAARPRTLSRDEQPTLYAYVDALCTSLGAPKPRRIDVDMQVNASASFRRGFLSLLGSDLVLTLGMPLTAGMTLGQWTGVLAHEFGHFTQGAAMRFTYLIGAVNLWFARVVHERDAWDERLDRWAMRSKWATTQIVLLIARVFIWASRRILWVLMMIGLAVSSFLSRQMELNADLHQARISGSDLFGRTHARLPLLAVAWERATSYLSEMWSEGRLADDLVGLVQVEAADIDESEEIKALIRDAVEQEKTQWLHTHPSTAERIAAVERLELPARLDIDAPATAVFRDFEALCRELTLEFYERALGEPVSPSSLVDTRTALAEREARLRGHQALSEYFLGTQLEALGIFPSGSLAPDPEPRGASARIDTLRDRMRSGATEVQAAIADLDRIAQRRRVAGLLVRAAEAKLKVDADGSGLSSEDVADPSAAVAAAEQERDATLQRLAPRIEEAARRIDATIALAVHPAITRLVGENADVVERLPRLVPALAAIRPQWGRLREIQLVSMELDYLLSQAGPTIDQGPFQGEVVRLWRSLRQMGLAFREELSDVEYPYDHAHGSKSLADFLIESVPDLGPDVGPAVAGAGQRLGQLYFRIWSDLASLAVEIETQLSLTPAEPVSAAEPEPRSTPTGAILPTDTARESFTPGSSQAKTESPVVTVHAVPASRRLSGTLAAALLTFLAASSMFFPLVLLGSLTTVYVAAPCLILFGVMANGALQRVGRSRDEYHVDEKGIARKRRNGEMTGIRWSEIGSIKLRRFPAHLEVRDAEGKIVFRLDASLSGFQELVPAAAARVEASVPDDAPTADRFESSMPSWWFVGTPVLWVALSMSYFGGIIFLTWFISFIQVGFWLFLWRTVRIEGDSLVVKWPFRERCIRAEDVLAMSFIGDERARRGAAQVGIVLLSGEVIVISGVKGGSLALFRRLKELGLPEAEPDAPARARPARGAEVGDALAPTMGGAS